jgi:hypothetical protein
MEQADREAFARGLKDVHDYYGKPLTTAVANIWWGALEHWDFKAVMQAMNQHVQNADAGKWLPKVADLISMMAGGTHDSALVAWTLVDRSVRVVGAYESVCFDEALINAVVHEMGGWVRLGTLKEDEWPFVKNEFVTRYRGYKARSVVPPYPAALAGISETANVSTGFAQKPVKLIGDQAKALRVHQQGRATLALVATPMAALRHDVVAEGVA